MSAGAKRWARFTASGIRHGDSFREERVSMPAADADTLVRLLREARKGMVLRKNTSASLLMDMDAMLATIDEETGRGT